MKKIYSIMLILLIGLGLQLEGKSETPTQTSIVKDSHSIGESKYSIYCSMCHGPNGRGEEEATKSLEVTPSSLVSDPVKKRSDDELFSVISNGVDKTDMLSWGELLTDEEISQIVDYVRVLQSKG